MAGEQVTVTMTGGGPYGFRLFGGESMPLSVAKVSGSKLFENVTIFKHFVTQCVQSFSW